MTASVVMPRDAQVRAESNLWLPPTRMRRYQYAKIVGSALMIATFVGWMVIQWSNPVMRWFAVVLLVTTLWVLLRSIVIDVTRGRGRQLAIEHDALLVTTPAGTQRVLLSDIASAAWRDDEPEALGLWLYDAGHNVLAHLDEAFLADENEARVFLGWARTRLPAHFPVYWPQK